MSEGEDGEMGIQDILGDNFKRASVLEVNTLESLVFSWRNGKFEAKPFPSEGQWAPAFGVCIADLNGDGAEDVFLSQYFFAVGPFESRCDAGRGLLLLGNGLGELSPMPGSHGGIEVYGEQRGCALSDYDGDGRVDLAVAQNGNATKLYHNVGATPGLRVRLKGPPGNPAAVGACLRLESAGKRGPVREAGQFPTRLLKAIKDNKFFVCLLAETTFESAWVLNEIEHAHKLGKTMIPVFQESYNASTNPQNEHLEALLQYDGVKILVVHQESS